MLRIFKEVSESYEGLFSSSGNIESAQPSAVRANTLQVFKSSSGRSLSSKSSEGIMSNAVKDESERSEDMSMDLSSSLANMNIDNDEYPCVDRRSMFYKFKSLSGRSINVYPED